MTDQPPLAFPDRLTVRQREIVTFVAAYRAEHYVSPTYREIGEGVGLSSSASVAHQIDRLANLGVLRLRPYTPRTLQVTVRPSDDLVGAAARVVRSEAEVEDMTADVAVVRRSALDALRETLAAESNRW